MKTRLPSLLAAVSMAGSILFANQASAMPLAGSLEVKNAAASAPIEKVWWRRGWGWGVGAGVVTGAIIGGALAAPYYYGPGPYYYGPPPPPPAYPAPVYAGPVDPDAIAYCARTYKSYDVRSQSFLGYDGARHPCP